MKIKKKKFKKYSSAIWVNIQKRLRLNFQWIWYIHLHVKFSQYGLTSFSTKDKRYFNLYYYYQFVLSHLSRFSFKRKCHCTSVSLQKLFLASLVAQLVKNPPAMQETLVWLLGWKISWRRERLPTSVFCPEEFHGLGPWGHKESDTTEQLSLSGFIIRWKKF